MVSWRVEEMGGLAAAFLLRLCCSSLTRLILIGWRLVLWLLTLTLQFLKLFVELLRSLRSVWIRLVRIALGLRRVLIRRHLLLRLSRVLPFGLNSSWGRCRLIGVFVALR